MKYSLYKYQFEDTNEFRLYLRLPDGDTVCYVFKTADLIFSNVPTVTRWFGERVLDQDDYYLYPIDDSGITAGEYEIVQIHEKFLKVKFKNGEIEGEWYIRAVHNSGFLFWKPRPKGFVCPLRDVVVNSVQTIDSNAVREKEQAYGAELVISDTEFSGPCMTSGIVTGMDRTSTLFTDEFLRKFSKKLQDKIGDLIVDIDHEFLQTNNLEESNTGKIIEIMLKEDKRINYIWCKGQTKYPIPAHAGLSMTLRTKAVWDEELKIWVAVDGDPIGVSITDKIKPACKVCWVE